MGNSIVYGVDVEDNGDEEVEDKHEEGGENSEESEEEGSEAKEENQPNISNHNESTSPDASVDMPDSKAQIQVGGKENKLRRSLKLKNGKRRRRAQSLKVKGAIEERQDKDELLLELCKELNAYKMMEQEETQVSVQPSNPKEEMIQPSQEPLVSEEEDCGIESIIAKTVVPEKKGLDIVPNKKMLMSGDLRDFERLRFSADLEEASEVVASPAKSSWRDELSASFEGAEEGWFFVKPSPEGTSIEVTSIRVDNDPPSSTQASNDQIAGEGEDASSLPLAVTSTTTKVSHLSFEKEKVLPPNNTENVGLMSSILGGMNLFGYFSSSSPSSQEEPKSSAPPAEQDLLKKVSALQSQVSEISELRDQVDYLVSLLQTAPQSVPPSLVYTPQLVHTIPSTPYNYPSPYQPSYPSPHPHMAILPPSPYTQSSPPQLQLHTDVNLPSPPAPPAPPAPPNPSSSSFSAGDASGPPPPPPPAPPGPGVQAVLLGGEATLPTGRRTNKVAEKKELTVEELEHKVKEQIANSDVSSSNVSKACANYMVVFKKHKNHLERLVTLYPFLIRKLPLKPRSAYERMNWWESEFFGSGKLTEEESKVWRARKAFEIEKLESKQEVVEEVRKIFICIEETKRKEREAKLRKESMGQMGDVVRELNQAFEAKKKKEGEIQAQMELEEIEADPLDLEDLDEGSDEKEK